ncbi:HU family DNA-binding protein [Prevotella sp.]|uniref:HU family DNA-binding protein n=1 Tax=Prevotella sp. TaxID=59823 RepID=UPI002A7F3366|nr:HU family DNA-binding protein [Prevotella sp.]MDY4644656.1 HU family DNA-binding protein [Prevotella sp.]
MTLKLSKSKAINPSTKKMGYRTTVKSNGKAYMDSLVASASKNTTLHKAELRMAFELMLDAIKENLSAGNIVELKGIGNIGFSCSGAWTETPEEQTAVEHKIGVSFFPSQEVHAAVATAKTSWTKDDEGDEPTSPDASGGTSGGDQKPPSEVEG